MVSQDHYKRIANLYDQFVKTDYDVEFFLNEAKKFDGELLELMSGTGRLTIPLLEAGITVTCVDFSTEMLAILQNKLVKQGLTAETHHMDVRDLNLGRQFKQIILPFQAFPEIVGEVDQTQALSAILAHLHPDGEFICTLHNPIVRIQSVNNQLTLVARHAQDDGGELQVWLLQNHSADDQLVQVLEFFERYDVNGVLTSKRYSSLQFHLLEKHRFEQMTHKVGFEIVQCYGNYNYEEFTEENSPFMIYVLRRKV